MTAANRVRVLQAKAAASRLGLIDRRAVTEKLGVGAPLWRTRQLRPAPMDEAQIKGLREQLACAW